jgi:DNA recombination protein RmuC
MVETLLWITLVLVALTAVLSVASLLGVSRGPQGGGKEVSEELRAGREEARSAGRELREEIAGTLKAIAERLREILEDHAKAQQFGLDAMTKQLKELASSNEGALDKIRTTVDSRVKELQERNEKRLDEMRTGIADGLKLTGENVSAKLSEMSKTQELQLNAMTKQLKELGAANQVALEGIRITVDSRVKELQEGNEKKLDEMRKTVDEKLHDTLEKRLGESFKLVSDRLEAVHNGLGEMRTLATGVGDLKKVLTNVKARGTWAEIQLGALLEQVLTSDQYAKNVCVKADSAERVEFAVRLPGPKDDSGSPVWLPIDSKFPQEDYLRLQQAADEGDPQAIKAALASLAQTVKGAAKEIHDKYVNPPSTTDFGIMFLATEGLYSEVLRQPDLVEDLQQRYRVIPAGPTSLTALLSSLRMGFQTLAIEQRASEVWRVLGAVKTEFGKFGDVLDKVQKQINSASRTIELTGARSRAIERKLSAVKRLPEAAALETLALPTTGGIIVEAEMSGSDSEASQESPQSED